MASEFDIQPCQSWSLKPVPYPCYLWIQRVAAGTPSATIGYTVVEHDAPPTVTVTDSPGPVWKSRMST
jgi:hypothetical protein